MASGNKGKEKKGAYLQARTGEKRVRRSGGGGDRRGTWKRGGERWEAVEAAIAISSLSAAGGKCEAGGGGGPEGSGVEGDGPHQRCWGLLLASASFFSRFFRLVFFFVLVAILNSKFLVFLFSHFT